jgi:hypothetical protein
MSQNITNPDHLKEMETILLSFKKAIEELPTEGGLSEQKSAERCQVLYYFCLGLAEYLPESHRTRIEPSFVKLMVAQVNTTMQPLIQMGERVRKSGIPLGEVLQYLIATFKKVHNSLYPNAFLLKTSEPSGVQSGDVESGSYSIVSPQHLEDVELIIHPLKNGFPGITQFLGAKRAEQVIADVAQTLFYTALGLNEHLPKSNQVIEKSFEEILDEMKDEIRKASNTVDFISDAMMKRGAREEEIIPYLLATFRKAYSINFPNSAIMPLV